MKKIIAAAILTLITFSIFAADLPDMPVKVTYRKAVLDAGYVFQFHNISEVALPIKVTLENPQTKTLQIFRLNIDPFKQKEIGSLEGWTAMPGDLITVENSDYKTLHVQFPKMQ